MDDKSTLIYEEIQTLMITTLCENAKTCGQDRAIWQHPMNEQVKAYCKANKYKYTGFINKYGPSKFGQQYMIIMN